MTQAQMPDGWQLVNLSYTAQVPQTKDGMLQFISDRLKTPIYVMGPNFQETNLYLQRLWFEHAQAYQVDIEADIDAPWPCHPSYVEDLVWYIYEVLAVDELKPAAHNVDTWYWRARSHFLDRTKLLWAPVAGPQEYDKHYPPAKATTALDLITASQTRKSGKGKISFLKFGLDKSVLEVFIRDVQVQFFDNLVDAENFRGAVNCLCEIGFVNGNAVNHLAIEWSPLLIHAYPISTDELTNFGDKLVSNDLLQGYALDRRPEPTSDNNSDRSGNKS